MFPAGLNDSKKCVFGAFKSVALQLTTRYIYITVSTRYGTAAVGDSNNIIRQIFVLLCYRISI